MVTVSELPSAQARAVMAALEQVAKQGSVKRSDVVEFADVSAATASRTLKQLEKTGWLTRDEKGDQTYYVGARGAAVGSKLNEEADDLASLDFSDTEE